MAFSRDPSVRLQVFVERGLIPELPTTWQLVQGQLEMAPYVLLPDQGDSLRYQGARLGHPLLRTPIVLSQVGLDHFRIGHGLHAKPRSLFRHLNFVFHEGMPAFDLQLIQSLPDGLERFRRYTREIHEGASPRRLRQRFWAEQIIPGAGNYREEFLRPGGYIDRAEAFDYPSDAAVAGFLRPEFTDLVRFVNYCASSFPRSPASLPPSRLPRELLRLVAKRFRK